MNQATVYINTEYTIPGAELANGIEPMTGWQPSKLYTAENTPADVLTNLTLAEVVSDFVGDMYTYYDNRFIVFSKELSDDYPDDMKALLVAGISEAGRIEPVYLVIDREWDDIQMLVDEEFLGCFR